MTAGWIVYIPDMGYGCLLMNKEGFFDDRTARSKLAVICGQYTGWGGVLFDVDNDGYLDLFVANGNAALRVPGRGRIGASMTASGNFIDIASQFGSSTFTRSMSDVAPRTATTTTTATSICWW